MFLISPAPPCPPPPPNSPVHDATAARASAGGMPLPLEDHASQFLHLPSNAASYGS